MPGDGFRVRFYSDEDAFCPYEVQKWKQVQRMKKFKFNAIAIGLGMYPGKSTKLNFSNFFYRNEYELH